MSENRFIESIQLNGLLSFPPDSPPFALQPLNVLTGPNGAGKSNLIEAFELLQAAPQDLAAAIREGGGVADWLWKGAGGDHIARITAVMGSAPTGRPLLYRLAFGESAHRVRIVDEVIEETLPNRPDQTDVFFYYRYQGGRPQINLQGGGKTSNYMILHLEKGSLAPDQSVLSQRKDPDLYPELTWTGRAFGEICFIRDWSLGRGSEARRPQPVEDPALYLRADARNLGPVLNQIQHRRPGELDGLIRRFMPRFGRLGTRILGGMVHFQLHEQGLEHPIPASRLSDGTLRFLAILAALHARTPPRLLCIENPERGVHASALELLAELLVEASNRMQLVITTHSGTLVSILSGVAGSVVQCDNDGSGTRLHRLEDN